MSPSLFRQDADADGSPAPGPGIRQQNDGADEDRASRRRRDENQTVSVLGSGLTIEGTVSSQGDVRIEGTIKGDVTAEGEVNITSTGVVDGEVTAARLVVAGKVNGSLAATDSARLSSGCKVKADVSSPRLQLDDGATLNGRVDMGGTSKAAQRPSTERTTQSSTGSEAKKDVA